MSAAEVFFSAQDGLRLFYRDYPGDDDKPALLCLPGASRNSKDFALLAERLGASRRIICPDYRGRGRSHYASDPSQYDPKVYLSDLHHLLVRAELSRFAVIGSSLGGLLGLGLCLTHPGRLAGLLLNDIGPVIEPDFLAKLPKALAMVPEQPSLEAAETFLRNQFSFLGYESDRVWKAFTQATYRQTESGTWSPDWDPALNAQLAQKGPLPDLWPLFKAAVGLPYSLLHGETSKALSGGTVSQMLERLDNLQATEIPAVGHVPSLEEPLALEALNDFFARCDA